MARIVFIKELKRALQHRLSKEEVNRAVAYYDELIRDRVELGELENEVIRSLGSISYIVKMVSLDNLEKRVSSKNIVSIISSSKSLLRLATTPILLLLAIVFASIMFSLIVALVSTFFGFAVSLVAIGGSAIYSISLVMTNDVSFFIALIVLGVHVVVFGILLIIAILVKDLIFKCINKSIEVFTKLFRKKVA